MLEDSEWEPVSLVTGFVIGLVLLGVVALVVVSLTGGSDPGGSDKATSHDVPDRAPALVDAPGTTSQPARASRLQRCTAAADVVEGPLQLAGPALDQWNVHVGAMNKLVVGAITLQQATAFWNQTRRGAYHRIGLFKDAEARLQRRGVDCPAPRLLKPDASPQLRACAKHVAAEQRALDSARTAITTWNQHMHAMDQLRAGQLSPTAATQMWLSMWQRGVHELEDFRTTASAAEHVGACDGSAGTPQPSASPNAGPGPSPASPTESSMSGMNMG
jgi:hypothetical protein